MATKSCQNGGIVFGDWKLFPVDERNWELCHRHATSDTATARKSGTVGAMRWHRCGKFYSYNTFHLAIQYAADCALKDRAHGTQMELQDALHEYHTITERMVADVRAAMGGAA